MPGREAATACVAPSSFACAPKNPIYDTRFRARLRGVGVRCVRSPPRAPKANAICERVVGTLRRECLDHVLVFGERHAERLLREYLRYYHGRPDRRLRGQPPAGVHWLAPSQPAISCEVYATPILGGLHYSSGFSALGVRSRA